MTDQVRWQRVNGEPFEYAIQQGVHGDEFVKLLDGSCLRRDVLICELQDDLERAAATLWRQENPDKSVFACDADEKSKYRARVLRERGAGIDIAKPRLP